MTRQRQRGSAMLVTLIVISALLAGAAVIVSLQVSSNRSTDLTRTGTAALFCAEAGLSAARTAVGNNYSNWNIALAAGSGTQPSWLDDSAFSHDIDNDGNDDFVVTVMDDDDDITGTNNKAVDSNYKIFVISTCTKYPDTPKQVMELVEYTPTATCYPGQEGGCNGRNNGN
jgi:hypothetical protein